MATTETSPKPRKKPAAKASTAPSAAKTKARPRQRFRQKPIREPDSRAKAAESATQAGRAAPPPISSALPDFEAFLSPDQRQMLETLSANLARAAVTAQGAIAEAALRQADRPPPSVPIPSMSAPPSTR
jgi:polyhydroxyalkanoate synthase